MSTNQSIIDIHVHSTLKPYNNSFTPHSVPNNVSDLSSIWHQDRSGGFDNLFENSFGISRYRQSDFSTLNEGNCEIVFITLYPIEKGFLSVRQNYLRKFEKLIIQFASMLGYTRISFVRSESYNYFEDLCKEYEFLISLNKTVPNGGNKYYTVISNPNDIVANNQLSVVVTIEGCHVFCEGTDVEDPENWRNLKQNVERVKGWDTPPFFVTYAHHFYNGLCTHAKSFYDVAGKLLNQEYGMRNPDFRKNDNLLPLNDLGKELIDLLLSKENGRRIFIDVKHMSREARIAYYSILSEKYPENEIPVIWSHGAVDVHHDQEINLDLELDVKTIYKTDGLIGIEMDQRILGYNENRFIKWFRSIFRSKSKKEFLDATYFWDQVILIAEFAYKKGFSNNPWKCLALGSDYDGVINPLNSYRDASTIPKLRNHLITHLNKYWEDRQCIIPKNHGGMNAETVVHAILFQNAYNFMAKHYVENAIA